MRHRLALWRPPLTQSHPHPHSHHRAHPGLYRAYTQQKRSKTFIRNKTEDGEVYYTLPRHGEGKQKPRALKPHELFQMPDLLLDLDALPPGQVREFNASNEDVDLELNYQFTERELQAQDKVGEIVAKVHEGRKVDPGAVSSLLNPWRVTDHDIMSVALRGVLQDTARQTSELQPSGDRSAPPIVRLTQSHRPPPASRSDQTVHPESLQESRTLPDATGTGLSSHVAANDPRRRPDIVREVQSQSGIPSYASKNETNLIRWMLVKQEAGFASQSPDMKVTYPTEMVAEVLRSQDSVSGVRRILFQCIAGGVDVEISRILPIAVRDTCAQIMDAHRLDDTCHRETLVFVNNLAQALPRLNEDWQIAILGIRLRCLAQLGQPGLTRHILEASRSGRSTLIEKTEVDIAGDVAATLETWALVLDRNDSLQTVAERRLVFRIAANLGETDASLRHILSKAPSGESKFRACKAYITLLSRLNAARVMYRSWKDMIRESGRVEDADDPASLFLTALYNASKNVDLKGQASNTMQDLAMCATLDEESIGPREDELSNEKRSKDGVEPAKSYTIPYRVLDDMMHLPFGECIAAVQKYCEGR